MPISSAMIKSDLIMARQAIAYEILKPARMNKKKSMEPSAGG